MALELLWSSKYYCSPELRMICVKGILLEDYKMHQCRKAKKYQVVKTPLEPCRGARRSMPWSLFLSSSVNECRGDLFV